MSTPSKAAMRAARRLRSCEGGRCTVEEPCRLCGIAAGEIDRETGLPEMAEALRDVLAWIDEVGAEAKRRDTERLAPARAALRLYEEGRG